MDEILITQQAGIVTCDFAGVKEALDRTLADYKNAVFTEDTKKDAKAVVASLRKNKKAFQERIKDVKNEYMKPYDEVYKQAIELVNMFDEPIDFINGQIEAFEDKRIQEKKERICELYNENVAGTDVAKYLPLEKIYNHRWENATYKESVIATELQELVIKATSDIASIQSMKSDAEPAALEMYTNTLDVTECILYINRHEQQKAEILERERECVKREEEERIRREERERIEAEQRAELAKQAAVEAAKQETIDAFIPEATDEPSEEYNYFIKLTLAEKEKLEMYMDSVGIEFEVVELPV